MTGERLTRTELSWLLTQEAKSAAETLRRGVVAPAGVAIQHAPHDALDGLSGTLDRLDETVSALASLHGQSPRGRRGRIDLAALVWEIAPEAHAQIEVGGGLVVLGEESELRRMLHVLMALGGDPAALGAVEVSVRRDEGLVRVAVNLGPDRTRGFEAETKWLSRMATRYGGQVALDGGAVTLSLPADEEEREVETLRRELAEAQAQGEAYARELAQVITSARSEPPPAASPSVPPAAPPLDALAALVGAASAIVGDVRGILASIGRDLTPARARAAATGADEELVQALASVSRHVTAASEIVADVGRVASCPVAELPRSCDVAELVRDVVAAEAARASRHDVRIELAIDTPFEDDVVPAGATQRLIELALGAAVTASPPGTTVRVRATQSRSRIEFTIDDAGTRPSQRAKSASKSRDFDSLATERVAGFALVSAFTLAGHLHAPMRLDDAPSGGARLWVAIPRASA